VAQDLLKTLDKETRDRHFPEKNGGKGDHARKSDKRTREAYASNYDKIKWDSCK
jgi:hypothetical protein|tara:strand:+ start:1157 stop:1318 length:162 start_codon:yes stop_codon:yes gene_type:complete